MIQVYSQQQKPLPDKVGFWLAIRLDAKHVGVVYRIFDEQGHNFLHLGFHHHLIRDAGLLPHYAWVECPGFDEWDSKILASQFDAVWNVNGSSIPYGILYSGPGYFEGTGQYVASDAGSGLTCATFVMALFEDFGFPLLRANEWPYRQGEDEAFQQSIVAELDKLVGDQKCDQAHVDAQKMHLGTAVRFRPIEVVAAGGSYQDEPVGFEAAVLASQHLAAGLKSALPAAM